MSEPLNDADWQIPAFNTDVYAAKAHAYALVVPVINEGGRIRAQLERIQAAGLPVDVVVADGGSTDNSLAADFVSGAGVRAVLTKTGPGRLSAQLRMAYAWCLREGYDGIVTIDGNGKDGVEAVATFVARLEAGYDYVQGSRYRSGGMAENTPLERIIGNRMIHAPVLSLAGRHWYTDTTNGFRGYSRRFLLSQKVAPFRDVFAKYELLFYLTARAGQLDYRVCEVPVRRSYPQGEKAPTKITGFRANADVLKQTLAAALGVFHPGGPNGLSKALRPVTQLAVFAILTLLLAIQFQTNALGIAPGSMFNGWQLNGQARVLGGIVADQHGLDKQHARLGEVYYEGTVPAAVPGSKLWLDTYAIFDKYPEGTKVVFDPYLAQFGLQEMAYSLVTRTFGLTRVTQIQLMPAVLTAAAVVAVTLLFAALYGWGFAALTLLCLAGAPFFISMARNLYWSPFLFFLPTLAAGWLYLAKRRWEKFAALAAVAAAMFLKSASDYEYITCITVLACSVSLVAPLFGRTGPARPQLGWASAVWLACVAGFVAGFLLHASTRGDTVADGIKSIYVNDVERRTYGDPNAYETRHDFNAESLKVSALDVLKIYLYQQYPDKRTMIMPNKLFLLLIALALAGIAYKGIIRHPLFARDAVMFFTFLAVPVSWFVLAKGHSFTETHINFILWYIGFMPALIFVAFSGLATPLRALAGRRKSIA